MTDIVQKSSRQRWMKSFAFKYPRNLLRYTVVEVHRTRREKMHLACRYSLLTPLLKRREQHSQLLLIHPVQFEQ